MSARLNSAVLLDVMIISESESEVSSTAAKQTTDHVDTVDVSLSRAFKICKRY